MPTYNYRCEKDGTFELVQRMKDHAKGECPTCRSICPQVLLTPPILDTEAMADIGMPGAFAVSGDRMTKRHQEAGQAHSYWRDD
jgi:putative FmdB family regulatory protein